LVCEALVAPEGAPTKDSNRSVIPDLIRDPNAGKDPGHSLRVFRDDGVGKKKTRVAAGFPFFAL
jgi:hypothetical protein